MKKIILFSLLTFITLHAVTGQCVPDTSINEIIQAPAGSRFDTVAGEPIVILPYAQVGQNYSAVIHFRIPTDTAYLGISGTIDSIKLLGLINLPPSLTVSCTPGDCVFPGGTYGCAEMTGTPTTPDSIDLRVAIEYTVTIGTASAPIRDTLEGYYLVVKGTVGLDDESSLRKTPEVYPNPASDQLFIKPADNMAGRIHLQIHNVIGNLIMEKEVTHGTAPIRINTGNLKPGVYLYSLNSDKNSFTGRFSISR